MKHFLVVGRVCGDFEDTNLTYVEETWQEAYADFVEDMWEIHLSSFTEPPQAGYRELQEANGEGVFVNGVFVSDTEITEAV